MKAKPIDSAVRIGHIHLKVSDLDRALRFYSNVLGFEIMQRHGDEVAFLSAGGYHHHIGWNTWESGGGNPPPRNATGLFHLAILYPTRVALADALHRLIEAKIPLEGASDHGVSEALYLRDPMGTDSSFTGIGRKNNGHALPTARFGCTPGRSIWRRYYGKGCRGAEMLRARPSKTPNKRRCANSPWLVRSSAL